MSSKADSKKKEPKAAPGSEAAAPASKPRGGKKAAPAADATVAAPVEAAKAEQPQQQDRKDRRSGPGNAQPRGQSDRIPKPDVAERDAQLEAINAEVNKLKVERDAVAKKIGELIEQSKGGNDEKTKARQEMTKIRDELKRVRDDKDAIFNQVKAATADLEAKQLEERKAKEGLGKFTTVEDIEEEIKRIEKYMTSNNFSSKEEKDMIREMDKLRLSKKGIGALKSKTEEVQKAKEARRELDDKFKEKKAIVDEVSKRFQNVRDALGALDAKDKEGIGAALPGLKEKKDALNAQIDALLAKKAGVYDDFKKKMQDFHTALEERKRLEKERREAEEERRRQEREEREKADAEKRKAIEEEEMKKKPWEAEIALCDLLISYLERLHKASTQAGSEPAKASSEAAPKRAGSDFGNMKPLVRGDDDYVVLGKKNTKGAAKEKAAPPKASPMTHTLDIVSSFALLSLIPPSSDGAIEASIAQLKEKRAYYDVLPRAPKAASAAATEAKDGAPKPVAVEEPAETGNERRSARKGGNAPPPSVQDASLFPHLPGSKPANEGGESKQKWGPKPTESNSADEAMEEVAEE